jgi:D-3-phosphoglycerate dehydrogenase
MSKPKVLISDALSPAAVQIFKDRGVDVDFQPNLGKDKDKLAEIIGNYDGLAIRSATKATAKIIEKATRLKVIGRAGIGVDNVEIPAATAKGIIVMNTPFGNSITTAEHAITLMLALAREIPQADASTQAGKWEKNRFMGVEITAKTLGVIGCGNIGAIVADRALGLRMKVIAFDPFLSPERAKDIGVEKVELEDLLKRADFITLHTPLTEKTKNIIDAAALAKMKKGVRIINCARGGLVDEQALVDALNSKHVAGAAFDVFVEEPATTNVLFGHPNVICTPHLGAATTEAQENVALQVAEQMSDYLLTGAISNAVNFPSITAEEAPKLKPFIELAEKLGRIVGPAAADAGRRQRGLGASCRQGAWHGGRRNRARGAQRLRKPDHGGCLDRAAGTLGLGHGLRRRQAAAGRHQGHSGRRRIRQVDDLRHQRGQARLHRRLRRPARCRQAQHRDVPSRPHQAGRRRHRAGRGRRCRAR